MILVFTTIVSLALANSLWQTDYINIWQIDLERESIVHWINIDIYYASCLYEHRHHNDSKISILIASLIAGIIGFVWLHVSLKKD